MCVCISFSYRNFKKDSHGNKVKYISSWWLLQKAKLRPKKNIQIKFFNKKQKSKQIPIHSLKRFLKASCCTVTECFSPLKHFLIIKHYEKLTYKKIYFDNFDIVHQLAKVIQSTYSAEQSYPYVLYVRNTTARTHI